MPECSPRHAGHRRHDADVHGLPRRPALPQQAIDAIGQGTRNGDVDQFGVRQIELFHDPEGKVSCLLEAPDEQAVRNHHETLDVPCGEVHRVDSLL